MILPLLIAATDGMEVIVYPSDELAPEDNLE